ncbi:putative GTP cyclohydrolase II [Annulohypoxylon truncatum]|uniref:putative GTP cyclohydrolase II n=1 Tax=Annulohypoxylon truncatum TaxID=327061 RepID=UPI002008114B|nr:putative GTP cyclohydrolase II [Annulohypoxylon truncatum]KAI1214957.1 putative GTP cyclohydrolase II [Annulohypoxylon truncatum]
MASSGPGKDGEVGMADVLEALKAIQENQSRLATEVESVSYRLDALAPSLRAPSPDVSRASPSPLAGIPTSPVQTTLVSGESDATKAPSATKEAEKAGFTSRIILTTYPKQIGINPIPLQWGASDAVKRGPVVVSRSSSTIRKRNAIGAHGGSYSIYYALALASKQLNANHRPDFTNTEPAAPIGPFPQWGDKKKIVAMDPWGHLAPWLFSDIIEKDNVDIRPTIAITKAHMKLPELEESVRRGRLVPDGKVCLNASGELAVTKFAVEPVWYLPGVAERFGIDEGVLRRSLFEHTGGSYPELITRGDIKVFLPPIGGLTVYCFGDPAKMSDEKCRLALRVHDECNGSDVFGSDICTCRPYLIFGIEEAVKEAQNGGSGVVIYFRKEGRALGEVTKYRKKRGEDRASDYFKRTENVAGVKDMRFQALMPDILHWLGIKKIDKMLSMSNMKHDAIVGQGIPIHERVELPEELIPADSRVEIDAKITAGYFTAGHRMTEDELKAVQGRMWDDIDH